MKKIKGRWFRLRFANGTKLYLRSPKGWVGLSSLVQSINPTDSDHIFIAELSLLEFIRDIIKGS